MIANYRISRKIHIAEYPDDVERERDDLAPAHCRRSSVGYPKAETTVREGLEWVVTGQPRRKRRKRSETLKMTGK